MTDRDLSLMENILNSCKGVVKTCDEYGNDYDTFVTNPRFWREGCMYLAMMGDLCKMLSQELKDETADIPWGKWAGIKPVVMSPNAKSDSQDIWNMIQNDLPELKEAVEKILN